MIGTFSSIFELQKAFPDEQSCIDHLEKIRWNGNVVSPYDETSKVYKCAGNKYKCKNTGQYFNVKTDTIFGDTKIPLVKWFMALYIFSSHKKGISSHQLGRDISITQKSAWFMLHRLRFAFAHPAFREIMGNTIEIDETYIGGRDSNKHGKKLDMQKKGTGATNKTAVFGMLEREGNVQMQVVSRVDGVGLKPIIYEAVPVGTTIVTDGYGAYKDLNKHYKHEIVAHSNKEYVRGEFHTNNIEGAWSQLKRGIYGIYHSASPKHLQSYCNEFALRYNTRRDTTQNRFDLILSNMVGRLTYKKLIA